QCEQFLIELAGDWKVDIPQGNDNVSRRLRRDVWNAWWKATEGSPLLEEFRRRSLSDADRDKVLGLIQKLGAESIEVRDQAMAGILGYGAAAAPLLRRAHQDPNSRVVQFAVKCLQLIEQDGPTSLPNAAVRLVALRKPHGAAEALLAYLPFAESDGMSEEIQSALLSVAFPDGKPDPILVKCLSDKVGARRMAAVEILCNKGLAEHRQAIVALLKDREVEVRLRTALALAGAREKEAIPVLISLLAELPVDQAWVAEDYLTR